ncbi:MAG: DUF362 domain-containing protein [Victivallaceae bacterium]|nr:DUF362 domain-containing protein [Victivallaceae bacterium]
MSNVYFKALPDGASEQEISAAGKEVLRALIDQEHIATAKKIPVKLHFGEKGNRTYLPPAVYDGAIDLLIERGAECSYIETSVLYGGERFSQARHLKLAAAHNFTRLPVVIADGAHGEDAQDILIQQKHFRTASIARALAEAEQVLVASHFKGHMLAGFGGAIKQLSMGFAAKGGKMAMHMGVKPRVFSFFCKGCKLCVTRCNENAITLHNGKAKIDHAKCVGCGACFSICPSHAVSIFSLAGFKNALFGGRLFREKLVEYAYASSHGKPHLFLTFAVHITRGCDCEPRPMRPCVGDLGVFASADPVAIDCACYEMAAAHGRKFRGREQLDYAEKIGLGSTRVQLIEL